MIVKLKVNFIPEWKLCNGSRGIVRDMIFPTNADYVRDLDKKQLPILMVEFLQGRTLYLLITRFLF